MRLFTSGTSQRNDAGIFSEILPFINSFVFAYLFLPVKNNIIFFESKISVWPKVNS